MNNIKSNKTIIIANGDFPKKQETLDMITNANKIICCDGALKNIINTGYIPDVIIGDLDSISSTDKEKYKEILIRNPNQNTNDLTKAVNYCIENNINNVIILGATGRREDHTLGNISLLVEYSKNIDVKMVSDFGVFTPFSKSVVIESFVGQQVSVFSFTHNLEITSEGLKYPLNKTKLQSLWVGTLNEAVQKNISINFSSGDIVIYQSFEN